MERMEPLMPTGEEYESRIKKLNWNGLLKLWRAITAGDTPGWEPGKALEYLILRAFDLDNAQVRWPFSVFLFGRDRFASSVRRNIGIVLIWEFQTLMSQEASREGICR